MSTFTERITTAVETAILSRVKDNKIFAEYYNRTSKKADWKRQAQQPSAKEIKDWINAIMAATDPLNPRRGELMRFYQNCGSDLHLGSCIDNRILPIQCAKIKLVDNNNTEDKEAIKLLEKPWYLELVRLVCLSTYEGTKLIELFDLNEKGEIKEVNEIPQSNFIAKDGIIIKEEWDQVGVSYKEGAYKDYYIQIGNDWNLGMLSQMAMVILAKKLGLGSWMSYIDKFGIPPIFAITNRMDTGRRDELFEMLENFRSNHFAVLQGQETITIPNNYSVDAYNSFDALTNRCNSEMSKRILGGTGISDEKSFVGAAEVHERLLKLRNQVDKLMFKFYFNEEIKPRLIKLSSVYAPFLNLTLEYDEKETLSLKEIVAAIKDLSQYYEFDVDELVKITGLPITAIKEVVNQTTPPNNDQKKKPNARVVASDLTALAIDKNRITAATWDKATENAVKQIYSGDKTASDLDNDIVLKTYAALSESSKLAWGKDFYNNDNARNMRDNLMKFSGAKTYDMLSKIESLKSQKLSEADYVTEAKKITDRHNGEYLNVEKQYTSASSAAAKDWEQFQKDKDIYQNLKLHTMEDEHVRDEHAALDGMVKPISEWTIVPPLGPRCRCFLEQTKEPKSAVIPDIKISDQYANNPGVSGVVFNDRQSYFQNIPKGLHNIITNNTNTLKQYAPYNKYIETKEGKKVYINDFHDTIDYEQNIINAKIVADSLQKDIYIRPHIDTSISLKNPEFGIGKSSIYGDLKVYDPIAKGKPVTTTSFVKNSFKSANTQQCEWIILNVDKSDNDGFANIAPKLKGELNDTYQLNKFIKNVVIIKNGKAGVLTRKQINSIDFMEAFNNLFK